MREGRNTSFNISKDHSQDSNFQGGHFWALQTSFDHGEGQSGTLSCFWNESLTGQHGKFMGPRFKKHSVLYFPEGREHPHLLATYVKLEPVCNVSSFPPYFKYSLYSSTCSMMTPRWRENICIEIKHEISYLDVSGALFHTIAQRSLLAMTPEEELL